MQTHQGLFYYDYQSSQQYCEAIRNGLFQGLELLFIKDNVSCYLSVTSVQHWVTFFEETHSNHVALDVRFCHFSYTGVSWNEMSQWLILLMGAIGPSTSGQTAWGQWRRNIPQTILPSGLVLKGAGIRDEPGDEISTFPEGSKAG